MSTGPQALVEHLERTTALGATQAERVVSDVLALLDETVERFVARRHRELRAEGQPNEAIFQAIAAELPNHRFCAPELSTRQLRRIVYG